MDVLEEIRQKLLGGKKPMELVKEGYAKSSVYYAAKKVRNVRLGVPNLPIDDELAELRRKREIIKLEKEIAELEAAKGSLPERVSKLEAEVQRLSKQLPDLVANCYATLYAIILFKDGWDKDEAIKEAMSTKNDFFKNFWPDT